MPRQSTSASNRGTPRPAQDTSRPSRKSRGGAATAEPSSPDPIALSPIAQPTGGSRKRKRQDENVTVEIGHQENGNAAAPNAVEEFTQEQQLEAWQEFAAEHYEMVEQLPLELHRNFRLLRELDDGCVAQTSKLQDQIRAYITARMELVKRYAAVEEARQGGGEGQTGGNAMEVDGEESAASKVGGQTEAQAAPVEAEGAGEMEVDPQPETAGQQGDSAVDAIAKRPTPDPESGTPVATPAPTPAQDADGPPETPASADPNPDPQTTAAPEADAAPSDPAAPSEAVSVPAVTITPRTPPPMPELPPDMGEPIPDGEGGLVVSSTKDNSAVTRLVESSPAAVDEALREPSLPETQAEIEMGAEAEAGAQSTVVVGEAAVPGSPAVTSAQAGAGPQGATEAMETAGPNPDLPSSGLPAGCKENGSHSTTSALTGQTDVPVESGSSEKRIEEGKEGTAEAVGEAVTEESARGTGLEPAGQPVALTSEVPVSATASSSRLSQFQLPARFLPEIGRLAREIVRNCDEKVALAHGAYNSIDRHIRALDSALSAQETSLILGLRPDTLPSANVDQTLNLAGDTSGMPQTGEGEAEDGEGIGGRNNKKKGKKGQKRAASEDDLQQQIVAEVVDGVPDLADADPNEPRYCYCNKVSWGTMIGCDNDACPLEWFHISCTGLQAEPPGQWKCNLCKPKVGLGMGGAGTVQAGGSDKRANKRKKRF